LFPTHAPAYLTLTEVEQRAARPKEAVACLERGRDATGKQQHILWQLAGLLIDAGRLDEAQNTVNELRKSGAPEMFLDHLQAHLDFAQGRWLAAINGFTKVRPLLTDWPLEARKVDFLLAECYGKLGRLKDQRDAYLRSAATDRSWLPALLGLAETKVKTGQIDEAIEDYRAILRLPSAPPAARLELARLLYLKNLRLPPSERNWKEVEQAVDEAERASPGVVGPTVLRAEVLIAKNAVGDAAKLLAGTENQLLQEAKALTAKRQTVLAEAEKLSGEAKTAKVAEAQKLQAEIQAKQASRPAVWQSMIGLAMNQRDWASVEQGLASAAKELGDVPLLRALRAKYLVERHGKNAATDIRKLAENVQAFSPEQQQWLWRALARLSYQAEDYPQTEALCRRVLEKDPGNIETQALRFQMAAQEKDVVAMEAILKEIRDTQATLGAFWYYGEAVRLVTLADKGGTAGILDRAKQSLAKAAELQPSWGQIRLLAGMIAERQHDENAAIEAYLQAVELGMRDPATVRRVGQLLSQKNRFREADRMFRLLGETQPILSDDARREMRSVKTELGEFEEAAELARKVAANSNQFEDHIWLGQLLGVVGKQAKNRQQPELAKKALDEAEGVLRKAVLLKSDEPEAWVALIQFYGQNDQLDKAEKTIAQAKRKLTPAQAAAALAQCYDVLGQVDQATKEYESALEIAPTDATVARRAAAFYLQNNQTSKGVAQLTRILDGKVEANEVQKSWARRALGSTLFAQGGEANRRTALELIERNLRSNPASAPDQYVKAVMLAADMSGRRRREAITSLETFLGTQSTPEPEIQFTLAQLYLDEADRGKYRTLMRSLLKETRNVRYLQAYAESLMQAGDLDEAQGVVDELAKLEPNSVGTLRARVDLAFRQRQYETVVRFLKGWLDRPADEQSNRENRLPLVAETLEYYARQLREAKQPAVAAQFSKEAQAIYQEYVNLKPNQELLMATFLARQGHLDEALALAEAKWPSNDPERVAMACFTLLNGAGATPDQVLRVERLLKAASDKHGAVTPLRIALAVLRDNQGRLDEAEGIYRAILAKEPENPTVLNNLAVLLALHNKNVDEAAELIERAIKKVGLSPGLLDSRAMVRMAQGKPQLALEDLQQSLKTEPVAMTYFHQAQAFQQNGQRTPAIEALKKARSLGLKAEQLQGVERAAYQKLAVTLD
jgi:cellulose synthase operon protein C